MNCTGNRNLKKWMSICLVFALSVLTFADIRSDAAEKGANSGSIIISDTDGFVAFVKDINENKNNYKGKTVLIDQDIEFSLNQVNNVKVPSGAKQYFQGTLDGLGHTISGIDISGVERAYLFSLGESGTIKNLKIKSGTFKGTDMSAGLVGYNKGLISNCYVTDSTIQVDWRCGGIVCQNQGRVINCCSLDNRITANGVIIDYEPKSYVGAGGIAYKSNGSIINCCNTSQVEVKRKEDNQGVNKLKYSRGGGIAALVEDQEAIVYLVYNCGRIVGDETDGSVTVKLGGIIGYINNGSCSFYHDNKDVRGCEKAMHNGAKASLKSGQDWSDAEMKSSDFLYKLNEEVNTQSGLSPWILEGYTYPLVRFPGDMEAHTTPTPVPTATPVPSATLIPSPTTTPEQGQTDVNVVTITTDTDSLIGTQTKQQKAYSKYAEAFERGKLEPSTYEFDKESGYLDVNRDGVKEMIICGDVYAYKNGSVKKLFKFPTPPAFVKKYGYFTQGVWWSCNTSKGILYNSNTSGWNGGHYYKVMKNGKKIKYLYGLVEDHDEKRTKYLFMNGKVRKISNKKYKRYDRRFPRGKYTGLGGHRNKTEEISRLHTKAMDHPVIYETDVSGLKTIKVENNTLVIDGSSPFQKNVYDYVSKKWIIMDTNASGMQMELDQGCLFTYSKYESKKYDMGKAVGGLATIKAYNWNDMIESRSGISTGIRLFIRNNKVVRINIDGLI